MRNKPLNKKRINIYTLGCAKNIYDSEVLMGQLKNNQIDVVHEAAVEKYDTIVINTCGFIENAKKESIDTIIEFANARKKGKIKSLFVTGCLSQRYKSDLEVEIPEVDAYFGTNHLPQLLNALGADYKFELLGERQLTTPVHYAFMKISEGCNRPCSFCAIPLMRGKHISTPLETIVEDARKLAKNGTKELILIAQDTTYYGIDLYGKQKLNDLLIALSKVEGIEWIRLQYAYPSKFPLEILDTIRNTPNICNYLDMPLQHISDNMLKIMRRGISKKRTLQLLDTIREKVPGIALRTTLLVGHPGETEKDFEELMEFVEKYKFDRLGIFTYSHEENTHAHTMEDIIPQEVKENRAERIMELQKSISDEKNQELIGSQQDVIIDRIEGEYFVGRTEFDSPEVDNEVLIHSDNHYLKIGELHKVKIVKAEEYDLYGETVEIVNVEY